MDQARVLGNAIVLASLVHEGQYDKQGAPYILHPLWVMNKVRHLGYYYMIVAILHDVKEDCPVHLDIDQVFMEFDIPEEIENILDILNVNNYNSYEEYIEAVNNHPVAKEIKLRDLEHNSKITRLKGITDKDVERMKKYHAAYLRLKG